MMFKLCILSSLESQIIYNLSNSHDGFDDKIYLVMRECKRCIHKFFTEEFEMYSGSRFSNILNISNIQRKTIIYNILRYSIHSLENTSQIKSSKIISQYQKL